MNCKFLEFLRKLEIKFIIQNECQTGEKVDNNAHRVQPIHLYARVPPQLSDIFYWYVSYATQVDIVYHSKHAQLLSNFYRPSENAMTHIHIHFSIFHRICTDDNDVALSFQFLVFEVTRNVHCYVLSMAQEVDCDNKWIL